MGLFIEVIEISLIGTKSKSINEIEKRVKKESVRISLIKSEQGYQDFEMRSVRIKKKRLI